MAILVVAPHPLDEVLGCGGTARKYANENVDVHLLVMFGDGTGRDSERRSNLKNAMEMLGIKSVRFGNFPENRGDQVPLQDLISTVEDGVRETRADTVFVPFGGSLHIDHHVTHRASLTAMRPTPNQPIKLIYAYEIQSSTEWALLDSPAFKPNHFINISETLEAKLSALKLYGDEMRQPPHARSVGSAHQLSMMRGASVGLFAAEAFSVVRQII